jgi:hypothetical protein
MSRFMTVKQMAKEYPVFSESSLRWLLFQNKDFRTQCARKIGKRVILCEEDVVTFINNRRERL